MRWQSLCEGLHTCNGAAVMESPVLKAESRKLAETWLPYARRWANRFARLRNGRRGYLEECVSAASYALCCAAAAYDPAKGPFPPLLKTALVRCLVRLSRQTARRERLIGLVEDANLFASAADQPDLDEGKLEQLLAALPPREARVVRLLVLGRMSLQQAGDELGYSKEAARQALRRALRRVRGWGLFVSHLGQRFGDVLGPERPRKKKVRAVKKQDAAAMGPLLFDEGGVV